MSKAKNQRGASPATVAGLVALVTVAVMVDGVRTEFAPGDELPEINAHDAQELLRVGSVKDPAVEEQAERDDAKALRAADRDFQKEREQVQAATASTANAEPAAG
jgi:hypothetical protein